MSIICEPLYCQIPGCENAFYLHEGYGCILDMLVCTDCETEFTDNMERLAGLNKE
jgi:hypothetical protein